MNAEVFISYASEDRLRILDLVERLRGAGRSEERRVGKECER